MMTKHVGHVTWRKGKESITVKLKKYIITYKQHMGGVDCGYHNKVMGEGLINLVTHRAIFGGAP